MRTSNIKPLDSFLVNIFTKSVHRGGVSRNLFELTTGGKFRVLTFGRKLPNLAIVIYQHKKRAVYNKYLMRLPSEKITNESPTLSL